MAVTISPCFYPYACAALAGDAETVRLLLEAPLGLSDGSGGNGGVAELCVAPACNLESVGAFWLRSLDSFGRTVRTAVCEKIALGASSSRALQSLQDVAAVLCAAERAASFCGCCGRCKWAETEAKAEEEGPGQRRAHRPGLQFQVVAIDRERAARQVSACSPAQAKEAERERNRLLRAR